MASSSTSTDELASPRVVVLGSLAFAVFWITATFPKIPILPIGRTAGALASAALMVLFQVETPDQAYASIDLPILGLLFGTMLVTIYLIRADIFTYLASLLSWKCGGSKDLLVRLSVLAAISSALLTNDTCCVLFTPFILKLCQLNDLPPEPFLVALATSSNIGSAATPIGNPQNLVIAIQGHISFRKFVVGVFPSMIVGEFINLILLLALFWKQLPHVDNIVILSHDANPNGDASSSNNKQIEIRNQQHSDDNICHSDGTKLDIGNLQQYSEETDNSLKSSVMNDIGHDSPCFGETRHLHHASHDGPNIFHIENQPHPLNTKQDINVAHTLEIPHASLTKSSSSPLSSIQIEHASTTNSFQMLEDNRETRHSHSSNRNHIWRHVVKCRKVLWKPCVYLVALGMLACLLAGLNLSWCTIIASAILIALDFQDAGPSLSKVSSPLLFFFSGMFIAVDGFNRTGLPSAFWNAVKPYAQINRPTGVAVVASVVILLSNVVSNVPTVLLLGLKVATSSTMVSQTRAWLMLAWASTVAGNLTLMGSAANIIVCEQARTSPKLQYHLSFWRHLRFGFLSTLVVVTVGLPLIHG